jgi:hypothetical protein
MKKNFFTRVLRSLPFIILLSTFSCWSPFEPTTHTGRDVVSSLDSNVTNLNRGFKLIDSVNLAVHGARSFINSGADTTKFRLQAGDRLSLFSAGSFGNDNAVAYADLQMPSAVLASLKTACDSSVDSVNLVLYYDTVNNDITIPNNTNTMTIFSCARKYFPYDTNYLAPIDSSMPIATVTFSRTAKDTFIIPLGPNMVAQLNRAIAGTAGRNRFIGRIDTTFGNHRVVAGDTVFGPDTVFRTDSLNVAITVAHRDTLRNLQYVKHADTAVVSFTAFGKDTAKKDTLLTDTLAGRDSIDRLTYRSLPDSSIVVTFRALHFDTFSAKFDTTFIVDTTNLSDTTNKFIGAVRIHVGGGGMVNFAKAPEFQIKYHAKCTDAGLQTISGLPYTYYDYCAHEAVKIPSDSLVASWQTDRFVEIPINLQPLWDSVKTGGGNAFRIVQDAWCFLKTGSSFFEGVDKHDTTQQIVYGLLADTITDSKAHSIHTRDSLIALSDRLKTATVHVDSTTLSLSMTMFLQSMADNGTPPTAYLYLFVKPPSNAYFRRVVFKKPDSIKFSALFSNSH